MNRSYRLVWRDTLGAFVAVAETARARGKRGAAAVLLGAATATAGAGAPAPDQLPTGGQVTSGQASIARDGARMDVVQNTDRAIIEWTRFDLGRDAQLNFAQPGASSVVLNRVLDAQPSQIFGRLSANGQVFIANPNGVYFSPTARVDVGGLVATSGRISDADFNDGALRFQTTAGAGSVVNEGRLQAAPGGYVALLAPEVRNTGVVVAELGTVHLSAGAAFELRFDGARSLSAVRVTPAELSALVDNGGAVLAPGGRVVLSAHAANALQGGVVRSSGTVEATGIRVGAGGRIVLDASHDVEVSGALAAAAGDGAGGHIDATAGRRLGLESARLDVSGASGGELRFSARELVLGGATTIDASGRTGGGRVLLGGGFRGGDPTLANAETTVLGRDVVVRASATQDGDGGQVVVWSERASAFGGRIEARGGTAGGDGGRVEVSGRDWLAFEGQVDAGAVRGAGGRLLLDPKNLTVSNAPQTDGLSAGVLGFATNGSGNSVINPTTITAVTNTGTAVVLQASNDLAVEANIVTSNPGGAGGDIDLIAGRSVTINALINTDGGRLNVLANAPVSAGVVAGERDAGAASLINNGIVVAAGGEVSFAVGSGAGHDGQSGSISTGAVIADRLSVLHQGPTAGGAIDIGSTGVRELTVTSTSARTIGNSFGDITVQGSPGGSIAWFDAGGGDITLTGASNDFDILRLSGRNVAVNDLNSVRVGASTISGNFELTAHGPMASVGTVSVAGATVLDAQAAAFGVVDPDITFAGGHAFQGPIRVVSARNVLIDNVGAVSFGGGASAVDGTLNVVSQTGAITATSAITADKKITLGAAGGVTLSAPVTSTTDAVAIAAGGDVALGAVAADKDIGIVAGGDATVGALTAGGAVSIGAGGGVSGGPLVAAGVTVEAGAAGDVTLTDAGNDFASITILNARDATIANSRATEIGAATVGRHLTVQAAGSISAGALEVGGDARFTVTAPASDLLLGAGGNLFAGAVTMATAGGGSYRNLSFANGTPVAAIPTGFPAAGLNDVSFSFAEAPAFAVPAMTITGNLSVSLPKGTAGGGITQQAGGIRMPDDKLASFSTSLDADVVIADGANQIRRVALPQANDATLTLAGALELGATVLSGDLRVDAGGAVTQSGAVQVAGSARFSIGSADLTLDNSGNQWNVVRVASARDVTIATTSELSLGASTITGNLAAGVPDAFATADGAPPVALRTIGETVVVQGAVSFENFSTLDLGSGTNRLGAIGIAGSVAPTSVRIREDHDITQAAAWDLPATPVELFADNGRAVLLTQAGNRLGDLTIVAGTATVTESDAITQNPAGAGWQTTGTTTLNAQGNAIDLSSPLNRLGALAIAGGASSVALREDDDITQAAAWLLPSTPITLDAGAHDIVLDRATNQLGGLALTAQNLSVVEDHEVTQAAGWSVGGLARVDAGTHEIALTRAANDFATLEVRTSGNAGVVDANGIVFGATAVGGTLNVVAGGALTQSAAIATGRLDAASAGEVRLDHAGNAIDRVGNVAAAGGVAINDQTGGIEIAGTVRTVGGDALIHTEGGDLSIASGARVEVLGAGNATLAAGAGFNFVNLNTGGIPAVLVDTGRYLIYTTSKTGTVKGNLGAAETMGVTYAANPPATIAGSDNRFLFADLNMLTITASGATRYYGDANPLFSYTVTGFLNGDTAADTLSGAPLLSSVADATSNTGVYPITVLSGSLATSKGYGFSFVGADLTVAPRPVSLSGGRSFDGTRTVGNSTLSIGGTVAGQQLALVGDAELFDPGVGANKPLDLANLTLADGPGGLAGNYTLAGGNHRYNVFSALTGLPSETALPVGEPAVTRPASDADFRQLAGQDAVSAKLLAAYGAFMLPGDLERKAAVAQAVAAPAPAETAAAANPVADPLPTAGHAAAPAPLAVAEPAAPGVATPPPMPRDWLRSVGQARSLGGRSVVFGADEAFAHGDAELTAAGRRLIDREVLTPIREGYAVGGIRIVGHTDPTGGEAINRRLSKRRADAGRDYLLRQGVQPALVRTEGRGSSEPVPGLACSIADLACWSPARRIEIHLTPREAGSPLSRK